MNNLKETEANFSVGGISNLPKVPFFKSKKLEMFTDFGTVFIGEFDEQNLREKFDFAIGEEEPMFSCPPEWRMPQLLKALGSFKSASQASKNGWNKDIPVGFSQHLIKIQKVKGVITIFKKEAK